MFDMDIDASQLVELGHELSATYNQVRLSMKRAARRTAATLRKLSEREMRDELQLKTLQDARRRLRTISKRDVDGVWFGLNAMPIPKMRGMPIKTGTGASFRGKNYQCGFVAKNKRGEKTIFKRKGRARLPIEEVQVDIKDAVYPIIERKIFGGIDRIFWGHFEKDLRARVKYNIGQA